MNNLRPKCGCCRHKVPPKPHSYSKRSGKYCFIHKYLRYWLLYLLSITFRKYVIAPLLHRYIEVYVSSNHQIQRESYSDKLNYSIYDNDDISPVNMRNYDAKFRVKLRGLPFNTNKRDVALFLEDFGIDEEDILFVDDGYRRTGIAFVFFANGEKARRAIRDKNHKFIGDRYIELFEAF